MPPFVRADKDNHNQHNKINITKSYHPPDYPKIKSQLEPILVIIQWKPPEIADTFQVHVACEKHFKRKHVDTIPYPLQIPNLIIPENLCHQNPSRLVFRLPNNSRPWRDKQHHPRAPAPHPVDQGRVGDRATHGLIKSINVGNQYSFSAINKWYPSLSNAALWGLKK